MSDNKSGPNSSIKFQKNQIEIEMINKNDDVKEPFLRQDSIGNGQRNNNSVKWKDYKRYFDSGYGIFGSLLLLFLFIFTQLCSVATDYWVSVWANKEQQAFLITEKKTQFNSTIETFMFSNNFTINESYTKAMSTEFYDFKNRQLNLYIYSIMACVTFVFLLIRPMLYYIMCVKAAKTLFRQLLIEILAKRFAFFIKFSEGQIMNRFNRDQGIIDESLPSINFDFIQISSFILITFGLSVYVNYFVVVPLIPLCIFLFIFRRYYIQTSRQLKRLEANKRGPVLEHLNSTNAGIATIRSAKRIEKYRELYHRKMNSYTRVNFPYVTIKRWFALRLDIGVLLFIILIIYGSILVKHYVKNIPITPASIGLLLAYCFQLSTQFQFCIRQSCEAENSMISVERVCDIIDSNINNEFKTKEDQKETDENIKLQMKNWPRFGKIEFKNVTLRYPGSDKNVLNDFTLTLNAGEHIGIIGYTGSGKSSIFNILLRLYEIESGQVLIDGLNISQINIKELRNKITIIPQDPILFSGSIRENLDPNNMCNDKAINDALKLVKMKQYFSDLDAKITQSFGKGEKQLLCFARGILKNSMIYLIDEATSNLSEEAEETIENLISKELLNKTVLIIAHHIDTLRNCNKILGLNRNYIDLKNDFGSPDELLKNPNSLYNNFINERGQFV